MTAVRGVPGRMPTPLSRRSKDIRARYAARWGTGLGREDDRRESVVGTANDLLPRGLFMVFVLFTLVRA